MRWRSRHSARPRSDSSDRSWISSRITARDPVQPGIGLQAAEQQALGDDLDAGFRRTGAVEAGSVADGAPDRLAKQEAMRAAAARVASRRGSSISMRPSPRQGVSSSASGTMVVLPAPGGATTTALRPAARVACSAGIASAIGSFGSVTVGG